MKKLVIVCFALITVGLTAAHAQSSANLTLRGNIKKTVSIAVDAAGIASGLDLEAAATDLRVATVTEKCNVKAGYTVTMSSLGAKFNAVPALLGQGDIDGEILPYSIKYDGDNILFDNSGFAITSVSNEIGRTPKEGVDKDLTISYSAEYLTAGDYEDTLTLEIAAK